MALSIDYMLQNGYNLVVIFTKHKYPSELKVWMEIVTDGTRTDLVQFTLCEANCHSAVYSSTTEQD